MIHDRHDFRRAFGCGVVAGLIAGAVLSILMLLMSLAKGQDLWMGAKGAGAPFLGERAMSPGFDGPAVLVGVLSHFLVSAAWGALFGVLFYGLPRAATIVAGLIWGVVVWLGMYYFVLPVVGLTDLARSVPVADAIAGHVLFGLAVALGFLPFQRQVWRPISQRFGRPILR